VNTTLTQHEHDSIQIIHYKNIKRFFIAKMTMTFLFRSSFGSDNDENNWIKTNNLKTKLLNLKKREARKKFFEFSRRDPFTKTLASFFSEFLKGAVHEKPGSVEKKTRVARFLLVQTYQSGTNIQNDHNL
jgi:hypothetical protein